MRVLQQPVVHRREHLQRVTCQTKNQRERTQLLQPQHDNIDERKIVIEYCFFFHWCWKVSENLRYHIQSDIFEEYIKEMEYFLSMNIQSSKTEKELILISVSLLHLLYILHGTSVDILQIDFVYPWSIISSICQYTDRFPKTQKPRFIVPRIQTFRIWAQKKQNFGYSKFTITKNLDFLSYDYSETRD